MSCLNRLGILLLGHGAHDRDRTGDLVLTKDVLYQLSYMGICPVGQLMNLSGLADSLHRKLNTKALGADVKVPYYQRPELAALKVRQASPKLNKECQPVNMILRSGPRRQLARADMVKS